ncbi:MAG TPA: dihydroneopterin aldolase [Bacteroidia bacterium]|nr:dihydroneopterin aldolase [Bacteroidia bacterium]
MIISLNNIKTYSYHGCLEEEAGIGGHYLVDVDIFTDFSGASESDDLSETVDYCEVYEVVKREMAIRSKLIEHVAQRIGDALLKMDKKIDSADVCVTKIAPPMNGDVESVSVEVSVSR